jgi:hypothetical protein
MYDILIYCCVVITQLALAVFKVLEIKWVVENNITKSVVFGSIGKLIILKYFKRKEECAE